MKKAIFFLYGDIRTNLYTVLAGTFRNKGYNIIFVVDNKLAFDTVNEDNIFCIKYSLLEVLKFRKTIDIELDEYLSRTIDVDVDKYSLNDARGIYHATKAILSRLELDRDDIVFGGSGLHVQDLAIKDHHQGGFKKLFSEIANIPGKTFFDKIGANLISDFYSKNKINTQCSIQDTSFLNNWLKNQKEIKSKSNYKPPQSSSNSIFTYLSNTSKDLAFGFSSVSALKLTRMSFTTFKKFIDKKFNDKKSDKTLGNIKRKYIFHPLQVSTDTQLLYNSRYDNLGSIKYYKKVAENLDLDLVIKYHPAEKNHVEKEEIYQFCLANDIVISDLNTIDLLESAELVGVNNSTVGLEAILLGKEVQFIGETFYKKLLEKDWLYYYLFDYLVDIDFFTGEANGDLYSKLMKLSE